MYLDSKICFRRVLMIFQKTNDPSMKSCFIAFRILWKEALRYAYDEPFLLRISNSIKSEKF